MPQDRIRDRFLPFMHNFFCFYVTLRQAASHSHLNCRELRIRLDPAFAIIHSKIAANPPPASSASIYQSDQMVMRQIPVVAGEVLIHGDETAGYALPMHFLKNKKVHLKRWT